MAIGAGSRYDFARDPLSPNGSDLAHDAIVNDSLRAFVRVVGLQVAATQHAFARANETLIDDAALHRGQPARDRKRSGIGGELSRAWKGKFLN